MGLGASATSRRTRARRCRNEPSKRPWRRRGCVAPSSRRTPQGKRARAAAWNPGKADRGSEVHQSLPTLAAEAVSGPFLHAAHVRVLRQHGPAERECGDGVRCVPADAGELRQVRRPPARRDLPSGAVEVNGPAVVPEPLPLADGVRDGGRREGRRGRPPLEPGEVARHDSLDLRLLEHDLADEDRVGIAGASPRKVAPVLAKPGEEQLVHGAERKGTTGG